MVLSLFIRRLVYISRTGSLFYRVSLYIIPRLEGSPPLMVWSALREVVSTLPTVTLVTLYSVRWMVPMLIIIPLPEQRSGFHVTDSYIFVTLYRVRWMTTNKKHFRRNVTVYNDTLLSIAEGRIAVQNCNHRKPFY
jgi:hypothetical protein